MYHIGLILIIIGLSEGKNLFDRVKNRFSNTKNEDKQRYFIFDSQTGVSKPFQQSKVAPNSDSNYNLDINFDDFASHHRNKYGMNRYYDSSLSSNQELILKIAGGIAWLFVTNAIWKRVVSFGEKFLEINSLHPTLPSNIVPFLAPNTTLNNYEIEISSAVIDPASIVEDVTSVGGLKDVKYALWDCVKTSINHDHNNHNNNNNQRLLNPVSGVLLYGPPGCGKTLLAKAVAKRASMPIIHVTPSLLLRKWVGESSLLTKAIFTLAKKLQPCILFIDEMDALLRSRFDQEMSVDRNLKTEFMQLWDGLVNEGARVMVVGASNRPQDLDAAIQRRFERSFLIALPNHKSRIEVLKVILRGVSIDYDFDWNYAATLTQGYTPSDLQALCKAAASIPIQEAYRRRKKRQRKELNERKRTGTGIGRSVNGSTINNNNNHNKQIMEEIVINKSKENKKNEMNNNDSNKEEEKDYSTGNSGSILDEMRPLTINDLKIASNSVFPTQWSAASYGQVSKDYQPGNVVDDNDDDDDDDDDNSNYYNQYDDELDFEDLDMNTNIYNNFKSNSNNNYGNGNTDHHYNMDVDTDKDAGFQSFDHDSFDNVSNDNIHDGLDDDDDDDDNDNE